MAAIGIFCNSSHVGVVQVAESIVNALQAENHELVLFANEHAYIGHEKKYVTTKNKKIGISLLLDFLRSMLLFIPVRKHCLTHAHFTTTHPLNLVQLLVCKICGLFIISSIHDFKPHDAGIYGSVIRFVNAAMIKLSDRVHVFSKNSGIDGAIVVPLGFKTQMLNDDHAGYSKRPKKILFFGRIEPYKGLDTLSEIISIVCMKKTENIDVEYTIAGSGYIDQSLKCCLERAPGVRLINRYINDEEIRALFGESIATVLPYKSATQSGIIVQSFSFGVPVIAFDVGSLNEYIINHQTGLIVPAQNVNAFAEAILEIVELPDAKYSSISNNCIKIYEDKYSEKAFARNILKIY